jgi:hypothetical protein
LAPNKIKNWKEHILVIFIPFRGGNIQSVAVNLSAIKLVLTDEPSVQRKGYREGTVSSVPANPGTVVIVP